MADYKVVDIEQLETGLEIIGDAIREKGGTTEKLPFPLGMKQAVEAIRTDSGEGLDTSDATATASDMLEGVTAYVDGEKITGNLPKVSLNSYYSTDTHWFNGKVHLKRIYDTEFICEKPPNLSYVPVNLCENGSAFGDAAPEDVAQGKTFTSANGLKIEGTHQCEVGYAIKRGTTTSGTIDTELSTIKEFFVYKESLSATGLIHLYYSDVNGTSYLHASAWSTTNYGSKTVQNGTTNATVNGGTITIPGTTATNGGLSSGVTYTWIAIGEE